MNSIMKSPFTGKEMKMVYETRTWKFRGEEYEYIHSSWLCEDSGERFTTDQMDEAGFLQVTNQYRCRYGIPYTDEILSVREYYGISAAKMSSILGFGTNQWRLYEMGEVPSVSNGRMIRSIMDPEVFRGYVHSARFMLDEKEYAKLMDKVAAVAERTDDSKAEHYALSRIYQCDRSKENGFAPQSLKRLRNALLFIINRYGEVFCTKMNKILFYADFLAFRRNGMSITGLSYRALAYGPVPERWDRVYSQFDDIVQEPRYFNDKEGTVLISNVSADTRCFSEDELKILDEVCERFADLSSSEISRISHEENAWMDCKEENSRIPFRYAFELKAI